MDDYTLEFDQVSISSKTTYKANQSDYGTATNITITPRTRTVSQKKSARSLSKRVYQPVPYIPYVQKLQALILDSNYQKLTIKQIQDENSQLNDKIKALNKELSKYSEKKQDHLVKNINSNKLEQQSVMSSASRQSSRSLNPKYYNLDTEIINTDKIIQKLRAENNRLQQREQLIMEPKYMNDIKSQIQAAQKVIQTYKQNINKLQQQKKEIENQLQDINRRNGIPAEVKKTHGIKMEISIFDTKIVEANNRLQKIQEDMAHNNNVMKEKNKIFDELCQKAKQLNVPIYQQKQKEMQEQDKRMHLKKLREKIQINEKNMETMEKQLRVREDEMKKDVIQLKRKSKDIDDDIWLKDRDIAIQVKELNQLMEEAGIEKLQQVNNLVEQEKDSSQILNTQSKELDEDIKLEDNLDIKNTTFTIIRKQPSSSQQSKRSGLHSPKSRSIQRDREEKDVKPKFSHLMEYKRKDSSNTADQQHDVSVSNQSKHIESQEMNENDISLISKPKFIIKKMKKSEDDQNKENIGYLKIHEQSYVPKGGQDHTQQANNTNQKSDANISKIVNGIALKKDGDDNSDLSDTPIKKNIQAKQDQKKEVIGDDEVNQSQKPTFNFRSRSSNQRKSINEQKQDQDSLFKEVNTSKNVNQQQNISQNNLNNHNQIHENEQQQINVRVSANKQDSFPKIDQKVDSKIPNSQVEDKTSKQEDEGYSFVPRRVQRNRGVASYTNDTYMPSILQNDQTQNTPNTIAKSNRSNLDNLFDDKAQSKQENKQLSNQQNNISDQNNNYQAQPILSRNRGGGAGGAPYLMSQENNSFNIQKPQEPSNFYNPTFGGQQSNNIEKRDGGVVTANQQRLNTNQSSDSRDANQQPKTFNFAAKKLLQSPESDQNKNQNDMIPQQKPTEQNVNQKSQTNNKVEDKEMKKPKVQEEVVFLGPNDRLRRPQNKPRENTTQKRNIFDENSSSNNQITFQVKDLTEAPKKDLQESVRLNPIHKQENINFFDENKQDGHESDGLDFLKQENKPKVNYDDDDDYTFSKNKKDDSKSKKLQIGQKPAQNNDQKIKELAQKAQNADLFGELGI
ncbi:hypothetical protein TTHERM_01092480 (macronuclear) [Tetrahymena thermophila SB210]|uniref:Uncharacterized protein n=1 Tax=Tetrahymena thermophila (strain SB210) TaxID=312017 RepID=Q24BN3_TETTS|nr:hypothetical protein TTHERM_01092480 [Tetrahymena thermophila SB210]EAS05210.2 hypothetical protein TTHERM_01092480 [Tetrahymena thermophila SB210]|eukprot:XP_001025455.2 hypothetical protein TTHERM_01092480 [Tetrahymena thermophila SB210]